MLKIFLHHLFRNVARAPCALPDCPEVISRDILREEEKLGQIRYRFEDPFFAKWISMFTARL